MVEHRLHEGVMKVRGLGCLAFGECVQGVYGFGSFEF